MTRGAAELRQPAPDGGAPKAADRRSNALIRAESTGIRARRHGMIVNGALRQSLKSKVQLIIHRSK
jgi:hypothetical protein